jgi:hypothetical protein
MAANNEAVRLALLDIHTEHGYLDAPLLVEVARDPAHVLHSHLPYEITAEEAVEKVLLASASRLIRSVKVSRVEHPSAPSHLRAFHAIPRPESTRASYEPVEAIVEDPFQRRLLLAQMERDWRTFRRRYEHLVEFAALLDRDREDPTG